MSIRLKTFLVICIAIVILSSGMYMSSKSLLMGNIKNQERQAVYQNIERTLKILDNDINFLSSMCLDWSAWDDTYRFVDHKNLKYINDNFCDETFLNFKLNFIAFLNSKGQLTFLKTYDKDKNIQSKLFNALNSQINNGSLILNRSASINSICGIVNLDGMPVILSAQPILKSNLQGPSNGMLIIGRIINQNKIKELERLTDSNIKIENFTMDTLSIDSKNTSVENVENLLAYSRILNDNIIEGNVVIKDIHGKNAFNIKLTMERKIYNQGYASFRIFVVLFFICTLAAVGVLMLILQKTLLSRLERLNNFIKKISSNMNTSLRVKVKGSDEIANLAKAVNLMLEVIDKSSAKIKENEERLKLVLEGTGDGFWDYNNAERKIYLSQHLSSMLEYDEADTVMDIDKLVTILHEDDLLRSIKEYNEISTIENALYNVEQRVLTKNGEWKWMQIKGKVVQRDVRGNPLRMTGIFSDITESKKNRETIEYLSYHDVLTGLYNRAYFTKALKDLDLESNLPLSIIIGDVNGLKYVNDVFNHGHGDKLLVNIANILKQSCRGDDIIARIGGDEFVIILPKTNESAAEKICNRIRKYCNESDADPIKPSIALGIITKHHENEDLSKMIDIAEDRMYKNKLVENKSSRHSVIALMERALLETDFETREHTERLCNLSTKIGTYMNLQSNQLDELLLLSKLHDIGKTAVPREILIKADPLSDEEWEIIKKHCEIGYRMALSSHDLVPIAELILSHHEKWDGSGYPRGLKGNEIPLLSRIISVVDAYDVITNSRPYKKAFTHEEALHELKRCSGTHFDPEIVTAFIKLFSESDRDTAV